MIYHILSILPFLIVLFWIILFILDGKFQKLHKRFFLFFLCVVLVNYALHYVYFNNYYHAYSLLEFIWVFTSLSVYPLYYYYIRLITIDRTINFNWMWILLPAFLLSIFTFSVYKFMQHDELNTFIHEVLYHNRPSSGEYTRLINLQILRINLFKIIFSVEVLLTLILGFRLINSFNKKIYAIYSNVENREVSKIKTILIFVVLASIISGISNALGKDYFTNHSLLFIITSLAHSIMLFGISYVGYKQSFSIRDLINETKEEKVELHDDTKGSDCMIGPEYDKLFESIKEIFETKKLYKNPELKMTDVASQLGTNRTYISKIIHSRTNLNFCDFVNDYRVKHAEELLSSHKESFLSIEDIAFESGFSGNSSFYRAFVKKNGIPPGRYRKIRINRFN